MRILLLCLSLAAPCAAQTSVLPPQQSGHEFAAADKPQITVEVRFLTAPTEFMRTIVNPRSVRTAPTPKVLTLPDVSDEALNQSGGIQLVSARRVLEADSPMATRILSDQEAFRIISACQEDSRSNILFAPRVTLFDGQVGEIRDTVERPFVVGLDRQGETVEPQIQIAPEGTALKLRCRTQNRSHVRIDLAGRLRSIEDVGLLTTGPDNAVVQVPRHNTQDLQLSARIPDGGTLLVIGLKHEVVATAETGVEMLNKVPYVNRLFRNSAIASETQDMLIMITPRIISGE